MHILLEKQKKVI